MGDGFLPCEADRRELLKAQSGFSNLYPQARILRVSFVHQTENPIFADAMNAENKSEKHGNRNTQEDCAEKPTPPTKQPIVRQHQESLEKQRLSSGDTAI
jgi:hypothetical protein